MKENWLNENLCSFDEKTRIELGPQLVKLMANADNLRNTVTSPHYTFGRFDALGKIIIDGEMMTVVDWRQKHKLKIWKIYQFKDGKFIKVGEDSDKDDALDFARTLAGEM